MTPDGSPVNHNIKINHPATRLLRISQGLDIVHPLESDQWTSKAQRDSLGSSESIDERSELFCEAEHEIELNRQIYEQSRIKLSNERRIYFSQNQTVTSIRHYLRKPGLSEI